MFWTGGIVIGLFILVILFISPIAKYLIEKYSVKYTGRQIKMDWAYVNPFTGYVYFNNFRIYEAKGDTLFLSMKGLSLGFSLHKLLSKEYIITNITLDRPEGIAIMESKNTFNFTDIINHFSSAGDNTHKKNTEPAHFKILNWKIKDGIFYLRDTALRLNYYIKDVQMTSPGYGWDADTIGIQMSFATGIGTGDIKFHYRMNVHTLDYRYTLLIHRFSMAIIAQYLHGLTNYGTFSAYMDANLRSRGNFRSANNLEMKGGIQVSDFHFGKNKAEDYLSFDTLAIGIKKLNPIEHVYNFDSLMLIRPYFKFEKYDYLDNIETMFGANGSKVRAANAGNAQFNLILEFAHYIAKLSENFFESVYRIDKVAITGADLKFNDYSPAEEFSIAANPLSIKADSVYKTNDVIHISLHSQVQPYGNIVILTNVHPKDSADFDLTYHLQEIPLSLFNPYLISYTSFPLDRGTIEMNGNWHVRQGIINSENHVLIVDPRVTKRIKNKATRWVPLWLVMAFVRTRSNVIDYHVPITGNLDKPDFHFKQVVFNILRNIFVKPVTTPYRFEVQNDETTIEKSLMLKWETRKSTMTYLQQKFLKKMNKFLAENPSDSVIIIPKEYAQMEKEYILFFYAKKKYYLAIHPEKQNNFDESDSEEVDKMSVKDSSFVHYLNHHLTHKLIFTIQEKCSSVVDSDIVNKFYKKLEDARRQMFLSYFPDKNVSKRVLFAHTQSIVPYDGFSYYKIDYRGTVPPYLVKAYEQIEVLNNEDPRKKYEKERAKIKAL